jgi:hypothetical protein
MSLRIFLVLVLVPVLNISCQTVGAVEDLTSKGVNSPDTEMASKTPDSKDSDVQPKASNSQDTAGTSKDHNSGAK